MAIGDPYVTSAQLKTRLGISDSADDTAIGSAVAASSRWIDSYCKRPRFGFNKQTSATALVYRPVVPYHLVVDDISSLTGLLFKVDTNDDLTFETSWTANTEYQFLPFDALALSLPLFKVETLGGNRFKMEVRPSVQITAAWGWPAVPSLVTEACYQLAEETFKLKDAPFGVAGVNDFGVLRIGNQTMNRVQAMLADLVVAAGRLVA